MKQYLLSMYQPAGVVPDPGFLEPIMTKLGALNEEMRESGQFVFTAGLEEPSTSTVVRADGDEQLITDGPYIEGKEHIGGFWIMKCNDLDEALVWARRINAITTLPLEVRPSPGHC